MRELDRIASAEAAQITFEGLAALWIEAERHTLKESSAARRVACVKAIAPAFLGLQIRHISARHCEAWAIARAKDVAAPTFTKELETMRGVFRYATAQGLILREPLWLKTKTCCAMCRYSTTPNGGNGFALMDVEVSRKFQTHKRSHLLLTTVSIKIIPTKTATQRPNAP